MALTQSAVLSRKFREGLLDYDLLPRELKLALVLCLESFDCGVTGGRVRLPAWASRLRVRRGECEKLFVSLRDLGMVDVNAAQGSYELRPHAQEWSRVRALRSRRSTMSGSDGVGDGDRAAELPLRDERPLSEALSEVSRDAALEDAGSQGQSVAGAAAGAPPGSGNERWRANFAGLKAWLQGEGPMPTDGEITAACGEITAAAKSPSGGSGGKLSSASSSLSSALIDKAELASSSARRSPVVVQADGEITARAWRWLEELDVEQGALRADHHERQWRDLCEREPWYVMRKLKGAVEAYRPTPGRPRIEQPIGYIARIAIQDGKLRRV